MLRYKDKNGVEWPLVKYENLYIEEVLDYGDKTLGFSIPKNLAGKIELEDFIRTKTDEFVIKQMNTDDNGAYDIVAKINIDELEGASFQSFETVEQTALDAANLALAGTGWTCECTVKKKRTVRMTNSSVWDILKKIADTFILEMLIDSLNKKIVFKEKIGEDKGVYFTDELNLVSLTIQSNSSDFYTRILPLGKDGLTIESVNGGSKLLENHTYSSKNKTFIWKDERYTVPESLKEDATAKLEELATPYTSYSCKIVDLANAKKIKAYKYKIGDVITIINKETHTRIKQRIVKLKSYPENPGENTCEISNLKLTFSAYTQKYNSTCNTVDNITNDNGTVDGDAIDNIDASKVLNLDEIISKNARFEALTTQIANVTGQLNANTAKIGTLENTKLSSAEADIKYATIEKLDGVEGKFEDFYAKDFESAVSKIEDLTVGVEKVNTLMFGSASGGSLTTEFSNSIVANIGDAQIKSAMIESIAADKITSGKIYTNLVEILSESGNLDIADNTIQIKDDNKVTRVQIGKDANSDYNMYVWDKSCNLMFDALGLTENGVKREIIRNDMIKEDANIAANKLNIESLFNVINEDGSHTLKSSKIYVDANKQTLDVAFKNMTTNVTNLQNTVTTQGTQLTAVQGQISSKVWQQDITTAVNGLQIGGRNLFQGTKKFVFQNVIALDGVGSGIVTEKYKGLTVRVKTSPWNFYRPTLTLEAGRYVFSSYVKGTSKYKGDIRVTNVTENTTLNANAFDINSEWERQSLTFELAKKANVKFSLESTGSGEIYECGWKLELGDKATDWTPAPEDTDSAISSVDTKVTMVSNQYTSLNQSLTSLTATVNSNTTKINSKADGSTVTALQSNMTALTADLNGFKTTVSETYTSKTEFNNLQIGGRNLLLNTAGNNSFEHWYTYKASNLVVVKDSERISGNALKFTSTGGGLFQRKGDKADGSGGTYVAGTTVTISGYIKSNKAKAGFTVSCEHGGDGTTKAVSTPLENTWYYFSFTTTPSKNWVTMTFYGWNGVDYYLGDLKLEYGEKATTWTPAPEDVDEKFTDYSTTTQMNSAINQSAGSILASVSSTYATKASLELKVDKNNLISEINASADVITLKSNRFVLDSTNAKIAADGSVTFSKGLIANWNITNNALYSDYGKYRSYIQTAKNDDTWIYSTQIKVDNNYYGTWYVGANGMMHAGSVALNGAYNLQSKSKGISFYDTTHLYNNEPNALFYLDATVFTKSDDPNYKKWVAELTIDTLDAFTILYSTDSSNPIYSSFVLTIDALEKRGILQPYIKPEAYFLVDYTGTGSPLMLTNTDMMNYGNCELSLWGTGKVKYNWHVDGTIYGNVSSDSDKNIKKDIKELDIEDSAQFIYSLIPSEFRFKNGTSNRLHHGLIAQDVKESMGDNDWGLFIDKKVNDENYNEIALNKYTGEQTQLMTARYSLRYDELIADLIATVQSLNNRLKALEK